MSSVPHGAAEAASGDAFALAALRSLPDLSVLVFDRDLRCRVLAGGATEAHGYRSDGAAGDAIVELERHCRDVLRGRTVSFERQAPGTDRTYSVDAAPLEDANGDVFGGVLVSRDVTSRHAADERLRESERRYRLLAEASSDLVALCDADGRFTYASRAARSVYGREPEELVDVRAVDLAHPDDAPALMGDEQRLREGSDATRRAYRVRGRDGRYRWVEGHASALRDAAGRFSGYQLTVRDIGERREAENLRRQWEQTFMSSSRGILVIDASTGVVAAANPAFATMHGRAIHDIVGEPRESMCTAESATHVSDLLSDDGRDGYLHYDCEHVRADGTVFPVGVETMTVRAADGEPLYRIAWFEDLTHHREVETARRHARAQFESAFAQAPIGMALIDLTGQWLEVNGALREITGYDDPTLSFGDITHPDDASADRDDLERLLAGDIGSYAVEKRLFTAQGHIIWVLLSVSLVRDERGDPLHFIAQIVDISARKRLEQDLHLLADRDPLTRLWNRRRFEEELERQVDRCRRYGERAALILFDLDHFKYVNDTLGHKAGDDVIRGVADAVTSRLRTSDLAARLGGDEFAVLLPNAGGPQAKQVAEDVCAVIREQRSMVAGAEIRVTASVGVTLLDETTVDDQDAMINADLAMYDAKDGGRDRTAVHDPRGTSRTRMTGGLMWSQRLRAAVADERFELHAQPIVDVRTGIARQYELLVRMIGDDGELILPGVFLYTAERFGFINHIDRWVIDQAIGRLTDDNGAEPLALEVNLSAASLADATLGDWIESRLTASGIDPSCLIFEVTETAAIQNMERARNLARRLHRLGCRFALDDFGSGFASFSYVKAFPLDFVKIDGQFIESLGEDPVDELVVRAVQQIADGVGHETIAEFVTSEATMEKLREIGVDLAQGFHLGRPAPLPVA